MLKLAGRGRTVIVKVKVVACVAGRIIVPEVLSWRLRRHEKRVVTPRQPPKTTDSTHRLIPPTTEAMKEALFESFCYEPITALQTIYGVN